jgi:protein arginine kinase activator
MYGQKTCMKCGKPATHKFTRVEKGQIYDIFLCAEHAAEISPYQKPKVPLSDILEGLLKQSQEAKSAGPKAPPGLKCSQCGLTFEEYRKKLLLGCTDCYASFRQYLIPELRRFHGDTRHRGRCPGGGQAKPQISEEMAQHLEHEAAAVVEPESPAIEEMGTIEGQIEVFNQEMKKAIAREDFAAAARCRDQIQALTGRLRSQASDPQDA